MSVIIFAARLSDAITDPLMGVLCDRTKTPWGRRKPWILIGTPLLMLALYKLFLPPAAHCLVFRDLDYRALLGLHDYLAALLRVGR